MLDVLDDIIRRHRHSGVFVDTNLLLVFLMAAWDEEVTLKFKRTQGYSTEDLQLLKLVLTEFDKLIITPAVLAEVSNLAGQLPDADRTRFFTFLSATLAVAPFEEKHPTVSDVVEPSSCFIRLGFADSSIEQLGESGIPILTDDVPLYVHLQERSLESFNFTHVRFLATAGDD